MYQTIIQLSEKNLIWRKDDKFLGNVILLKRSFFVFAFLFCMVHFTKSEQFIPSFEAITNDKGLSHNTVYDICQDDQGFMWFATEEGLNRYDGKNVKQYFAGNNENLIPSNTIPCLVYTSNNKLFVGTSNGLALYNPCYDNFTRILYKNKAVKEIIAIQEGADSELLISTENIGSFIYYPKSNKFIHLDFLKERIFGMTKDKEGFYWAFSRFSLIRFNKKLQEIGRYSVSKDLFNSAISYIKCDRKGVLWVGTFQAGLYTFNYQSRMFTPFLSSNKVNMYFIRTIEDGQNPNEYWVGTEKGLYVLNIQSGHFEHYTQSFDLTKKTINDNAIYKVFKNRQNVFFVGTYFGGVNIAKTQRVGFNTISPDNNTGSLHGKALSNIVQSPTGKLWIATEDAGIAIFDEKKKTFSHLLVNDKTTTDLSTNNVHALLMDGKDICWAGHFLAGLSRIDTKTGKAKSYMSRSGDPTSLSNNFVFALSFLSRDSILVGTISGIDIFDKKTEKFSRFRPEELNDCFVYDIFNAPDGKKWICTYNKGIFILDMANRGLMTHYQAGDKSGLPGNSIISYSIDGRNRIWIGTRGDGLCLFNPVNKSFKTYNDKNLLINNVVYGILEDSNQNLWISSNKGISRINIQDNSSIHFNYSHGLAGNQYNFKSYFKNKEGYMFFGSVSGLTWFHPDLIQTPKELPTVHFTNFQIFNETVLPDKKQLLKNNIDFTDEIKLKYDQNSFTLEFTSVNYFDGNVSYQYYLEGLENSWSPLTQRMQANYTNLSPGEYIFHIRATNKISNQTGKARTLTFIVSPPFWATWLAYFIYFVTFVFIISALYKSYTTRQREKVALTIEKIEKENLRLLHQHKMNFFTYISHEFKTPLSIIIASVEILFQGNGSQPKENEEIHHTIKRSAMRLLTLVNQLMEFRKIETDHAVIHIQKGDIVDFFNQIMTIYRPLLEKKEIELKIQVHYDITEIYFDFDKLEKIFTNLLTNAVKFTPQNGEIILQLHVRADDFDFSVKDSGKGLNNLQIERIFEVFYSEKESKELVESSGVGLALTSSLVKLLKGEISVESEPGKGCKFMVNLPYLQEVEGAITYERQIATSDLLEVINIDDSDINAEENGHEREFSIIIAEDNKDLLKLISKKLRDKYVVKGFEDGLKAWEYIQEKTPDVLITDVMMPIMGGIELCEKIKTNINLCHIPVIMLTAKTTNEARMEGLHVGADMYIPKPFSMEELEVVLNNIIKTRVLLKTKLVELAKLEGFEMPSTNHEQAFVEKVFAQIHENIEESAMDVQFLADKLNISRSGLHNKIKMVMKMSTTEFINTVRINKAKEMMQTSDLTFSEISYKIGYSDSAYFSRIFKKLTGKTPREFRQKQ